MRNVAFGCFSRGTMRAWLALSHEKCRLLPVSVGKPIRAWLALSHEKRRFWLFLSGNHQSLADVKPCETSLLAVSLGGPRRAWLTSSHEKRRLWPFLSGSP